MTYKCVGSNNSECTAELISILPDGFYVFVLENRDAVIVHRMYIGTDGTFEASNATLEE
jgi:hypothetical protein